jgi:hypothetical protein
MMMRFPRLILLVAILWATLNTTAYGQSGQCIMQVGAVNADRWVRGLVQTECASSPPWGNWGVTSNVGWRTNGDQFQGHEALGGHLQWASCATDFPPPDCDKYNRTNCTEQQSDAPADPNNLHGGFWDYINVSCPYDIDANGTCDIGGCLDTANYTLSNNWMSLYELDHPLLLLPHDLVTTLYFNDVTAYLSCDVWGCYDGSSAWEGESSQTSPVAEVSANLAVAVINIGFSDTWGQCADAGNYFPGYWCY